MKVLFLNPSGGLGGAERSLLDVLESIRAADQTIELEVILGGAGPLVAAARDVGASVQVLAFPENFAKVGESSLLRAPVNPWLRFLAGGGALPSYAMALRAAVRASRADVVHTNGIKMHLLGAALRTAQTPLVWHVRDFLSARKITARLVRLSRRRVDLAVVNSEAVGRDLTRLAPGMSVSVVLNGIDTSVFRPDGPRAALDEIGGAHAPQGTVRIGLVSAYARWKGHETFFDAARRLLLRDGLPPMRFYVVGGSLYETGRAAQYDRDELVALARAFGILESVVFVPFQRCPEDTFRALDIVVHASTRPEPFGRTIVEAMACGRAVVVSRAGGAAELFSHGDDALGIEPGNAHQMADAVALLASQPERRAALGRSARRTVVERFDRRRLGHELLAAYQGLKLSRVARGTTSER